MRIFRMDVYNAVLLRCCLWGFYFLFFFVCRGLWIKDGVDQCTWGLILTVEFLVFSYFCFYIWVIYVLDLVCIKHICSLNVIIYGLTEA